MTIGGVLITDEVRRAMVHAAVAIEDRLGRKLRETELDMVIMEVVRRLAEPEALTVRLQ